MKRGFINQKLGKRNSRRSKLLKSKAYSRPSALAPRASKPPHGKDNRKGHPKTS